MQKSVNYIIIISLVFSFHMLVSAQIEGAYWRNHIYAELLGNAAYYSVNYERRLLDNLSARIGLGFLPKTSSAENIYLGIPITASYLIGKSLIKFEIGLGTTFLKSDYAGVGARTDYRSYLLATGILGLRLVKSGGGLTVRFIFTPFYSPQLKPSSFQFSGGISIGHSF
ncbi:MAG: hypothetical protein KJN64_08025 [Ignavibacteria bacterium]|nr:hypothetical protein [Ignavibacteria bacterium]